MSNFSIKISISGFSISAETKLWKILEKISDENSSRKCGIEKIFWNEKKSSLNRDLLFY
jgi:hypothetical protein